MCLVSVRCEFVHVVQCPYLMGGGGGGGGGEDHSTATKKVHLFCLQVQLRPICARVHIRVLAHT